MNKITSIGEIKSETGNTLLKMWQVDVIPGPRILREHRHIDFEIALMLDGNGIYHTSGGKQIISSGDVFVFPGNEPHCITETGPQGLSILNLHFKKQFTHKSDLLTRRYPELFFTHSDSFANRIPASESTILRHLILELKDELSCHREAYEAAICSRIELLFIELFRNHTYYAPTEEIPHNTISKIMKGVEYIDQAFDTDITLEEIAAQSGITPNYFSRLFNEYFKIKLWDYIISKRIEKAKELLCQSTTERTILEVALSCGFHNTANFNKAFRAHTGMTPKDYKIAGHTQI